MPDLVKRLLLGGAGLALLAADKVKEVTDELVQRGEMSEQEAKEYLEDLRRNWEAKMEGMVKTVLTRLNIPSRDELEELKNRVKQLESTLAQATDAPPRA